MSGIGEGRWVNDYIGIPYKFGGRDFSGVDCYGLCCLIYKEEYGEQLPDWLFADERDLKEIIERLEEQMDSEAFQPIEQPIDGCFAICYRTRAAHHMGLYLYGGIIHAHDPTGSIFQTRSMFEREHSNVVYGVWNP